MTNAPTAIANLLIYDGRHWEQNNTPKISFLGLGAILRKI